MKKRWIRMLLALTLILSMAAAGAQGGFALAGEEFDGAYCTNNSTAASVIDYIRAKYPDYTTYPGSGLCYGYAEKVSTLLASSRSVRSLGVPFNEKYLKKYLLNTKPGAHVVLSRPGMKHSIVILKLTEDEMCWTDNNRCAQNTIGYYQAGWDHVFDLLWNYDTIEKIYFPKKYSSFSVPKLAAVSLDEGGGSRLSWTKTGKAKSYAVYRSSSRNGAYKKIAVVKGKYSYTDRKAPIGKKQYYKVKPAGGRYSNVAAAIAKLAYPAGLAADCSWESKQLQLNWEPVSGATSYRLERYDDSTNTYQKVITTRETQLLDTAERGLKESDYSNIDYTYYRIRSYDKNSGKSSKYLYFSVRHSDSLLEKNVQPLLYTYPELFEEIRKWDEEWASGGWMSGEWTDGEWTDISYEYTL